MPRGKQVVRAIDSAEARADTTSEAVWWVSPVIVATAAPTSKWDDFRPPQETIVARTWGAGRYRETDHLSRSTRRANLDTDRRVNKILIGVKVSRRNTFHPFASSRWCQDCTVSYAAGGGLQDCTKRAAWRRRGNLTGLRVTRYVFTWQGMQHFLRFVVRGAYEREQT